MKLIFSLAVLLTILAAVSAKSRKPRMCTGEAKYRIKFVYQWTPRRFPTDFPPREEAIFSPLTGASHNYRFTVWTRFGYATEGVEQIAETGANSILREALSNNAFVKQVVAADGPVPYNGTHTIEVSVAPNFSRISALTMVFPSPDWFTGIRNMEMCSRRGRWLSRKVFGRLLPYDAGTDSGERYRAADADTQPRENIAVIRGSPFYGVPVGYYEISRMK